MENQPELYAVLATDTRSAYGEDNERMTHWIGYESAVSMYEYYKNNEDYCEVSIVKRVDVKKEK